MTPVRTLAAHEWRLMWRDGTAVMLTLVLSVALMSAAAAGLARVRATRADVDAAAAREQASRMEIRAAARGDVTTDATRVPPWGVRHPDFVANDRGTYAAVPSAPLLALATGQTDLHPTAYKITASRQEGALAGASLTHPLMLATGAFDVLFVLIYLLPIVAAAATFDLVTGERERRTLPLLLAQGVPVRTLVLARMLPRAGLVIGPALALPLMAVLVAGSTPDVARLGLWLTATGAYGVFWLGLSVLVSARARSSTNAALTLGGLWLLLVVVIPATLNLLVTTMALTPSGVRVADATRAATRDAVSDGSRVLGHFLEDHPTASGVGRDGLRQYALLQAARDQEVERRLRPLLDEWEAALERQRWWVERLQVLSPPVMASAVLTDAAGSGTDRQRQALRQLDTFREAWRQHFAPLVIEAAPLDVDAARTMPVFMYEEEPWQAAARRSWLSILLLVIGGVVLCGVGIRHLERGTHGAGGTCD